MHRIVLEYCLWRTARRFKTSRAEVRRNITEMLAEAQRNPDPEAQAAWAAVPRAGDAPTAEETFAYLTRRLREKED